MSHAEPIREALSGLLGRLQGAFLILEEPDSGKFVQFAGSREEPLMLDLPCQALSEKEAENARVFFEEHGVPEPQAYAAQSK